MGKTNQPLRILVDDAWSKRPEVQALAAKGHTIDVLWEDVPDLILSSTAHYWTEDFWDKKGLLEAALKRARGARPKEKKKKEKTS